MELSEVAPGQGELQRNLGTGRKQEDPAEAD